MKSGFVLAFASALSLIASINTGFASFTVDSAVPASSPSIVVENQFFVDHPELNDEGDAVSAASRMLAAEGYRSISVPGTAEALAAKSREFLAERSGEEWQRKAIHLYPDLGIAGSELNTLFLKHYRELKASSPSFTDEPSWPVLLAMRCDDEIKSKKLSPPEASSIPPAIFSTEKGKAFQNQSMQSVRPQSGHPWQNAFSIFLLLLITTVPGAYALKKVNARFAPMPAGVPSKGDASLWGAALKHTAILYVIVALASAIHTLFVNSDLGFLDRLAVSAAVGTLFGLCVSLPLCVLDALFQSIRKQGDGNFAHR